MYGAEGKSRRGSRLQWLLKIISNDRKQFHVISSKCVQRSGRDLQLLRQERLFGTCAQPKRKDGAEQFGEFRTNRN